MVCEKHQRDLVKLGQQFLCPACVAQGATKTRFAMESSIARMRQGEVDARVVASGIPDRFIDSSFESFYPPTPRSAQVAQALRNYVANFEEQRALRTGFIFTGGPGTAKTHLACAMALALLDLGYTARYISMPRLTLEIRRSYKSGSGTTADIISSLIECDFLVLDEIDLHGASDNDYQVLYEIINSRYELGNQPTLALSNRPLSDLTVDLNERLVTRLLAGTQPIVFNWEGRRDQRSSRAISAGRAQ